MRIEIWKDHPEIDDLEVSTLGGCRKPSGKKLGIRTDPAGYKRVSVLYRGKRVWRRVHQLVMDTFSPSPVAGLVIDHIDDDKSNNALENLQWRTNRDNLLKAARLGKMNHGGGRKKPIVSVDEDGFATCWESSAEASRELGIGDYTIARVLGGVQIEAKAKEHSYRFYYIKGGAA